MSNIQVFSEGSDGLAALGRSVANYVVSVAGDAILKRGRFTVAISGGSLPKIIAPALTDKGIANQVDWTRAFVFFVDERCVPHDDPESNARLVYESLLYDLQVPNDQVFLVDTRLPPAQAAEAYAATLASVFDPPAGHAPSFDLILLGMGPDGHTASLFPNHALLDEQSVWVAPVLDAPKPPPERITFTLPILNTARHVAFVATGAAKQEALAQVLGASMPNADAVHFPARLVQPEAGELLWFVDEAAAQGLE